MIFHKRLNSVVESTMISIVFDDSQKMSNMLGFLPNLASIQPTLPDYAFNGTRAEKQIF
ncbi:hypothetical protein P3T25_009215 [Paraburkholderia sp. GAS32]